MAGRSPGRLRLATFNIQHARRPGGAVDVDAVSDVVAGLDAEVVGLQEVDVGMARSGGVDLAARVAEAAGMEARFGASLERDGGRYGNALLVRGASTDVEVLRLPGRPDGRRAEPRTALLARVGTTVGPVSVGVCHLGLGGAEARGQLAAALAALAARPGPRVLLGDWNLPPRAVLPIVSSAGFALVGWRLAWLRPTFPARPLAWRRIDHVAVDGLRVLSSSVRRVPVSDHRPLVVELSPVAPG